MIKPRHNPFSAERIDSLAYHPQGTTFEQIVSTLEKMNFRGAITGPEGSGKSTLLRDLASYLCRSGHRVKALFINDTEPLSRSRHRAFGATLEAHDLIFVDGADQLGSLEWWFFKKGLFSSAGGLVITSHQPGMLPTLVDCTTTESLFLELTGQLLPESCHLESSLQAELYRRHKGNIRHCFRDLYDHFAG